MKRRTLFLGALLLLCGCATTANYKKVVGSWVGADAETLVSAWGYPSRTFEAPNGNTVYEYSNSETYQTSRHTIYTYDPQTRTGFATTHGGDTLTFHCRTFFEVNGGKKVVKASFKGNSCKATAPEETPGAERGLKR
ncbi:MAG: hypothetical protein A2X32_09815 [Elusimicrobia bacterium GWC2_64_44]|nr:MAG: hypothetical protein A2X32_09815 [Elusimicrobia bacterium GWC2_64_44]